MKGHGMIDLTLVDFFQESRRTRLIVRRQHAINEQFDGRQMSRVQLSGPSQFSLCFKWPFHLQKQLTKIEMWLEQLSIQLNSRSERRLRFTIATEHGEHNASSRVCSCKARMQRNRLVELPQC